VRTAHRQPVRAPSEYADVPPVDRLVSSLLSLDAMARPRHAAEVMDRLSTLADLGPNEPVSVRRAYLNPLFERALQRCSAELAVFGVGRARPLAAGQRGRRNGAGAGSAGVTAERGGVCPRRAGGLICAAGEDVTTERPTAAEDLIASALTDLESATVDQRDESGFDDGYAADGTLIDAGDVQPSLR
jgi:hypothetical protein